MRRSSLVSAINSIGRAAAKLTPKKDDERRRHAHRRRDSFSSSSLSSSSFSEISESDNGASSSEDSRSVSRSNRKEQGRRGNNRGHLRRKRRSRSITESPGGRKGRYRHHRSRHSSSRHDDAEQMVELLGRLLPFYGTGDQRQDALVIDTIHRLPPHSLEINDNNGTTLLLLVCQFAAYDLLPTLLSKGCNVNASNTVGATPLHFSCFSDTFSAESAMALIRHGAVAEVVEHEWGCTPLHWAAFAGHVELCRVLCIAGANPTTTDKCGNDPISYSRQSGNPTCTAVLESFRTDGKGDTRNLRWERMIDGNSGSSFYHNKDTGESLWGTTYRQQLTTENTTNFTAAETVGLDEIVPSPGPDNDYPKSTGKSLLSSDEVKDIGEIPLDDIVEVESVASQYAVQSNEDQLANNDKQSPNCKTQTHSSSINSWDNEDAEPKVKHLDEGPDRELSNSNNSKFVSIHTEAKLSQSFEDRMSLLHEKMESQLMDKLQMLEEKISQSQQQKASEMTEEELLQLKPKLTEMSTTVMQLRTDVATKDLEVLKLKQKIIHLESCLQESLAKPATRCVNIGDGELNPDKLGIDEEELLADKERVEQELSDVKLQLASSQRQVEQTNTLLVNAEGQLRETQNLLKTAEQTAKEEKASRASIMLLLENQAQKDDADSLLMQTISEEKQQAEAVMDQLRQELIRVQESAHRDASSLLGKKQELEEELLVQKTQIGQLEREIKDALATNKKSLVELKGRHDKELEDLKTEMAQTHRSELQSLQHQVKEEQLSRIELEVASNEAIHKMEVAETKLAQMTALIQETESLKITNDQLHFSLQEESEKRKQLHNTLEDLKGRIRVYVRIRPLSKTELDAGYLNVMTKEDERTVVMAADPATLTEVKDWEFDKIFSGTNDDGNTQESIFNDTSLLITSAIDGFNVCIFAYGQTGSGKTYTMFGGAEESNQGLAPRVAFELFNKLKAKESSHDMEVTLSMLELYTDKLNDLLVPRDENIADLKIKLAEHTKSGLVEVEGAKVEHVMNGNELLAALNRGAKSRVSSSTKMNANSSRSHMISTIVLSLTNKRTGKVINGKLTLVDLAGSERVSKSGATGHQLKEAQSINKSLSALGDVIGALTSGGRNHIPYRNHPLTMLMSDSIGGNAKTLMFVCASPCDFNRKETTNSLDFAKRCRNVTNNVVSASHRSSKGANGNQIKALRAELSKIKDKEGTAKRRSAGMRRPGMS